MLLVTIAIWPDGDRCQAQTLARAAVGNISDLAAVSDYLVVSGDDSGASRSFVIRDHRRDAGVWELVRRVAEGHDSAEVECVPREYQRLVQLAQSKLDAV